jgi:chromosome segregation ATPase
MESKETNSNNLPEKINKTIAKTEQIIKNGKSLAENINSTTNNLGTTLDKSKELIGNINDLKKTYLESERIKSDTTLGLEKIKQNHQTINKHIDTEYKKQKQTLDTAERSVDKGLENGDIDLIKKGLDAMISVANHNPMADLKNHLDNQIEKDFGDDDFIIEI